MGPWGTRSWGKSTPISDRFFLGGLGPGPLRGFRARGIGQTDVRRPARNPAEEVRWGVRCNEGRLDCQAADKNVDVVISTHHDNPQSD